MKCPECGETAEWRYDIDYPETHVPECSFAGYGCECGWEYEPPSMMPRCNPTIETLVKSLGGTYSKFYRAVYKGTDCGPTVGFEIPGEGWVYCDDLPDKKPENLSATAVSISSIVEGSDDSVSPIILEGDFSEEEFWKALEWVNREALYIWKDANGEI
tara:strand:- start:65 stop:538 length:474 start_codon:yes stop_codon:yes gene_type:complete